MKAKRRSKDLFISVFDIFGQHLQTKKPWNSHELQGKRTRFSSVIQDKKNVIQEQIYLPCQNTPNVFMACKNTNYTLYYIERTYFNCIKSLIDDSFTFNWQARAVAWVSSKSIKDVFHNE